MYIMVQNNKIQRNIKNTNRYMDGKSVKPINIACIHTIEERLMLRTCCLSFKLNIFNWVSAIKDTSSITRISVNLFPFTKY